MPLRRLRRLIKLAALGLTVAAISQEMAKPEAQRTWQGTVFGFVPYDFRPPTWDRIREAYWNPKDSRVFTERVFGVGWAVNLYQAREWLAGFYQGLMGEDVKRTANRVYRKAGDVAGQVKVRVAE
jgi:hypothetical protein